MTIMKKKKTVKTHGFKPTRLAAQETTETLYVHIMYVSHEVMPYTPSSRSSSGTDETN